MNTSIYIAGPMTGYKEFNFPAFYAAEDMLRGWGWRPINPAKLDEQGGFNPKGEVAIHEWRDMVHRDLSAITKNAGAIFMLKGWEDSQGARTEWNNAIWLRKRVPFDILYESSIRFPSE